MAAEQGHVESQFELGQMYAQGVGTTQNFEEAVRFFELSAQKGHAKAQFNLAFMIARGQGTEENFQKAYEWYTISHLCGYQIASQTMAAAAKKITAKEVELANWRAESFVHQLADHIADSYSH
jgi:TPR repeat protein